MNIYDSDFYTWTEKQTNLLRMGRLAELDVAGLIEEIEGMSASERRELKNRLQVLLAYLLKWRFEPQRQSKSWKLTIKAQRIGVRQCLQENPGLKSKRETIFAAAYELAKVYAAAETGLDETIFPNDCPWSFEQIMQDGFLPE